MESFVLKLSEQARAHPTNLVLRQILSDIHYLLRAPTGSPDVDRKYQELQKGFGVLATQGLWSPSADDENSLRALGSKLQVDHGVSFGRSPQDGGEHDSKSSQHSHRLRDCDGRERGISIVQPPPLSAPLLPVSSFTSTVLPIELVQTLNHTFFLHILATDPQKVLPPGKSLLSMLSAPRTHEQTKAGDLPKLEERVKDLVHGAFWQEALESLSNPSPDIQLPRLRHLYDDLLAALKSLVPHNHPVMLTLVLPLSPTNSPLRLAILHLREILVTLRQRCAPARDTHLNHLIDALDEPHVLASTEDLAKLVTDTARAILDLSEAMKEDLSQFVLGSMEEKDLRIMITQQAMLREKALVLQSWPPSRVESTWKAWLRDSLDGTIIHDSDTIFPPHRRWSYRLVQALMSNSPVNCSLPTRSMPHPEGETVEEVADGSDRLLNVLPPPFFLTCPALHSAQNFLQALVIAGSLRSLVRLPAGRIAPSSNSSSHPAEGDASDSFTQRVWTLLKASIEEVPGADDTKVVNLADEVIRARRACADKEHPCGPEEEARLRAAVDRTLQPHDAVFLLLRKRLMQALAEWLISVPARPGDDGDGLPSVRREGASAPVHMHTGRESTVKRPKVRLTLEDPKGTVGGWERERGKEAVVKGFEDDVLVRAMGETFRKVGAVVDWTDWVWQDLIETGEIGGSDSP